MSSVAVGDDKVKIIYLELLARYPTSEEIAHAQETFLSETNIRDHILTTPEYKMKSGTYVGDVSYNRAEWKITVDKLMNIQANYQGITLANGKLAMITQNHHLPVKDVYLTRKFDFDTVGQYANNVVRTFNATSFSLGVDDAHLQTIDVSRNRTQSLHMKTGIFTYSHDICLNEGVTIAVDNDIYPLRAFPFTYLQTLRLRCASNITLDFYHYVEAPTSVRVPRFHNNLIHTNDVNYYFFTGIGETDEGKSISSTSTYIFPSTISVANKGFNVKSNNLSTGFNRFSITLPANTECKLHILTTTMSQYDFSSPEVESQRVLINLLNRGYDDIRLVHVKEWEKQWIDSIDIEEKIETSGTNLEWVRRIQKHITFALFNIYSAVRDDVNVDVNPLNLSIVDIHGHLFWSAELFLIPLLLFVKHKAARGIISYRYAMLENARKLAMAHGFKGGRFPFQTDVMGYQDMYWDTASPLYVYNSALISISVWNYYRVTKDHAWLVSTGYTILKEVADFFVSKVEKDSTGNYHINHVLGVNHIQGNNNAITNYFAKMALKYAIEATYELNYRLNPLWVPVYQGLKVAFFPVNGAVDVSSAYVIKLDDAYGDTASEMTIRLFETLLILHPYYSKEFHNLTGFQAPNALEDNIRHNLQNLHVDASTNYWNTLLLGTLRATQSQQTKCCQNAHVNDMSEFMSSLESFLTHNTVGPWEILYNNTLPIFTSRQAGTGEIGTVTNDISISAMFLLMLVTGIGGLRIVGGINAARFYYEEFQIITKTGNVMPDTWKNLTVQGVGVQEITFNITNKVYKPNTCT